MQFICPTCSKELPRELSVIIPHTEDHIVDEVKKKNPNWVEADGICKKCYEYYKNELHPKD